MRVVTKSRGEETCSVYVAEGGEAELATTQIRREEWVEYAEWKSKSRSLQLKRRKVSFNLAECREERNVKAEDKERRADEGVDG